MDDHWRGAAHRARARLSQLSQDDRLAIALHEFDRVSAPDFVAFDYCDGPNGVRGHKGATAFPSTLAVAAAFDLELARLYGSALGREVLTAGKNAILAPALDIARVPQGGRAGENLGEDPFLAGEIGGAVGAGIQLEGVLAVAKHFVANNFEWLRTGQGSLERRSPAIDIHVSDRPLHEIYLEPFRRALVRYGVTGLLGSYNRLNGRYTCQDRDLLDIPRTQWGWDGVTVPDFLFAVRDPRAALEAGLDLPALGGGGGRTREDLLADEPRLDRIVLHVLTAAEYVGLKPMQPSSPEPPAVSAEVAKTLAIEGMVLLKNDDSLLPLANSTRVAVIDGATVRTLLVMGGAASVTLSDERIQSVPEALGRTLSFPDQVKMATDQDGEVPLPVVAARSAVDSIEALVRDQVTGVEHRRTLERFELAAPEEVGADWSATVTTMIRAERSGRHHLTLTFGGQATIYVDDQPMASGFREASPFVTGPDYPLHALVDLEAGQSVRIRVEYATSIAITIPGTPIQPHFALGWRPPDDRIEQAAALAGQCDVALVLAGRITGESMDADALTLPGAQPTLIGAVAAANPRTVVVTLGAGPVIMPWLADVAAVLHAWFPGEQFAPALADVLTGRAEPGGRLPITFPTDASATPIRVPEQYPGVDGVATYSEGLQVGYRWYHERRVEAAFPFGHGLGYTSFELDHLRTEVTLAGIRATFLLRNVGSRDGKAVPQAYLSYPSDAGEPSRQLKGFQAVRLQPGEERTCRLEISYDDLAIFDEQTKSRVIPPGEYGLQLGFSSQDLRVRAAVELPASPRTV